MCHSSGFCPPASLKAHGTGTAQRTRCWRCSPSHFGTPERPAEQPLWCTAAWNGQFVLFAHIEARWKILQEESSLLGGLRELVASQQSAAKASPRKQNAARQNSGKMMNHHEAQHDPHMAQQSLCSMKILSHPQKASADPAPCQRHGFLPSTQAYFLSLRNLFSAGGFHSP